MLSGEVYVDHSQPSIQKKVEVNYSNDVLQTQITSGYDISLSLSPYYIEKKNTYVEEVITHKRWKKTGIFKAHQRDFKCKIQQQNNIEGYVL